MKNTLILLVIIFICKWRETNGIQFQKRLFKHLRLFQAEDKVYYHYYEYEEMLDKMLELEEDYGDYCKV